MNGWRTTLLMILLASFGFGFSAQRTPGVKPLTIRGKNLPAIIFVQARVTVPGGLRGRFPQGSRLVRYAPGFPATSPLNLTPALYAVADPEVSFDARMVLFSAKKTRRDHWQIWEMNVDGSNLRQITHCPGDCFQPAYLPHDQIVYTVVTEEGVRQRSTIYVSQRNGADPHPITFGPGNYEMETVLRSGRLLVSAGSSLLPAGQNHDGRTFYTLRPDGSGLNLFRDNDHPGYVRRHATQLRNGTLLFVKAPVPVGGGTGGALALIRQGNLHDSVLTPPTSAYWSAHVLDGNTLVVAKEAGKSPGKTGRFALYTFDLTNKMIGSEIYSSPTFSSVDAVPVESHASPVYYPSVLHLHRDYGRIVCLDSYLSSSAPRGRIRSHIARVRVIALRSGARKQRVLGEAPVESDGSFYIKVAADLPVRFELLGKSGSVIRAQKSWIWARNGEDVACLGCHENPAMVPRDHFPLALKRAGTPIPIGLRAHAKTGRQ